MTIPQASLQSCVSFAEAKAQPAASGAPFQPSLPSSDSAPEAAQKPLRQHRHHKSTEEIMRIFDRRPQQDTTFSSMPSDASSQGPYGQHFMPPDSTLMQGPMANLPPEQWPAFQMPQVGRQNSSRALQVSSSSVIERLLLWTNHFSLLNYAVD